MRARERKRASRSGGKVADVVALPAPQVEGERGPVEAATFAELEAAGREYTALGQSVLKLAARLDVAKSDTGTSLAALAKQHATLLADALKGAAKAASPVDEVRAARERRHGRAG